MVIAKESAPHLRRKASVTRMMVDVLIALAPTLIFSFVVFPIQTLTIYLISVFIMVASEFVYVGLRNMMPNDGQKHTFKEKFAYAYKGKITQKTEDLVGPYILHDFFLYHFLVNNLGPKEIYKLALSAFKNDFNKATIKHWLEVFFRRFFSYGSSE